MAAELDTLNRARREIEAPLGFSVMEIARRNGIDLKGATAKVEILPPSLLGAQDTLFSPAIASDVATFVGAAFAGAGSAGAGSPEARAAADSRHRSCRRGSRSCDRA